MAQYLVPLSACALCLFHTVLKRPLSLSLFLFLSFSPLSLRKTGKRKWRRAAGGVRPSGSRVVCRIFEFFFVFLLICFVFGLFLFDFCSFQKKLRPCFWHTVMPFNLMLNLVICCPVLRAIRDSDILFTPAGLHILLCYFTDGVM